MHRKVLFSVYESLPFSPQAEDKLVWQRTVITDQTAEQLEAMLDEGEGFALDLLVGEQLTFVDFYTFRGAPEQAIHAIEAIRPPAFSTGGRRPMRSRYPETGRTFIKKGGLNRGPVESAKPCWSCARTLWQFFCCNGPRHTCWMGRFRDCAVQRPRSQETSWRFGAKGFTGRLPPFCSVTKKTCRSPTANGREKGGTM